LLFFIAHQHDAGGGWARFPNPLVITTTMAKGLIEFAP